MLKYLPYLKVAGVMALIVTLLGFIQHAATVRAQANQAKAYAAQQAQIADSVMRVVVQKDSIIRTISARVVVRDHYIRVTTPTIDSIIFTAPDTCKPAIAAVQAYGDTLKAQIADLFDQRDSILSANHSLLGALGNARAALDSLAIHPIKTKTLDWFKPHLQVGVQAGYDPFAKRVNPGIGLSLGWRIF